MTDERPIITTVQVRAQDLTNTDNVMLAGVETYEWHEQDRAWKRIHLDARWHLIYDVDNDNGDSSIDEAQAALNDMFRLIRIDQDYPNATDHPDLYVAIHNLQLVTVQRENRGF